METENDSSHFNPDILAVLGGGAYASVRRAIHASNQIKKGLVPLNIPIILSGGVPKKIAGIQDTHGKSEAEIMYEILISRDISKEQLSQDKYAQSTKENLTNLHQFIRSGKFGKIKNIGIVDGYIHSLRTRDLAREILPEYEVHLYTPRFDDDFKEGLDGLARGALCEGGAIILELVRKLKGLKPTDYAFYNNPRPN
jgi:uncharacterized SAM-binding protein YcdF (DUF218 family)